MYFLFLWILLKTNENIELLESKVKQNFEFKNQIWKITLFYPRIIIGCIYTETVFSCKTIKSSEQFGWQYKHLDTLLDE